jgi:hypothetical protein
VINQFILPLLYASNAAVFCFSFTFLALGKLKPFDAPMVVVH